MKVYVNQYLVLGAAVLCLSLAGCKGARRLARAARPDTAALGIAFLKEAMGKDLAFSFLEIKGKGHLVQGNNSQKVDYRIHIEHDKQIWISLSLLGIEGARAYFTPDTAMFRLNTERKAFRCGYGFMRQQTGLPVDFQMLQSLLLGQAELAKGASAAPSGAGIPNTSQAQGRLFLQRQIGMALLFFFDSSTQKLTHIQATPENGQSHTLIFYGEYQDVGSAQVPYFARVEVRDNPSGTLELRHSKFVVNPAEAPNFRFTIPDDYEIIPPPR